MLATEGEYGSCASPRAPMAAWAVSVVAAAEPNVEQNVELIVEPNGELVVELVVEPVVELVVEQVVELVVELVARLMGSSDYQGADGAYWRRLSVPVGG